MKLRWIFLITLVVTVAIATGYLRKNRRYDLKSVVELNSAKKVNKIAINDANRIIWIKKDASGEWWVDSENPFPADAKRLGLLIAKLTRTTLQQVVSEDRRDFRLAGLRRGVRVKLFHDETLLDAVVFGDERSKGGRYIRLRSEPLHLYLIDELFDIDASASSWEHKTLVSLDPANVQSIEYIPGQGVSGTKRKWVRSSDSGLQAIRKIIAVAAEWKFAERRQKTDRDLALSNKVPTRMKFVLVDGRQFDMSWSEFKLNKKIYKHVKVAASGNKPQDILLNRFMGQWIFEFSPDWLKQIEVRSKDLS